VTGDQVRSDGSVGFASGSAAVIRSVAVTAPSNPPDPGTSNGVATGFVGLENPFEFGTPTADGLTLGNKNTMLPIANPAPLVRKQFSTGTSAITSARLYVRAPATRK